MDGEMLMFVKHIPDINFLRTFAPTSRDRGVWEPTLSRRQGVPKSYAHGEGALLCVTMWQYPQSFFANT